jgi:heme/copper-type cytochrome/quinol oxidase subunit 2
MGLWEIFVVLYLVSTAFALYMTRREQRQTGQTSVLMNSMGFAVCTVWPLVMVGMLAARALRLA